jgi:hypothetical protein
VNSESTTAIFLTAFEYVANDLRKKFSQFLMCCMTVFLTVSFITFLNGAGKLSPIIVLKNTVFSAGDYDITILGRGFGSKEIVKKNNFYNDHAEIWDTPFQSNNEKMKLHTMAQLKTLATVNFTSVEETINHEYEGHFKPIEVFPRWMA